MKKLFLLVAIMSLCIFMTACDDETMYDTEDYSDDAMASEEEYEDDMDVEEDYVEEEMTISDYIDMNYDAMYAQHGDLEAEGMTLEIFERDNALVYHFEFVDAFETADSHNYAIDQLALTLESNSDNYTAIFENLASYVPSAELVVVEYFTVDGEMLSTGEFGYME